ncbi:hypothetical protein HON22_03550, partial [Candidatus Peregrinibacteria bacterium]|jgi:hypothetical protein|nr:hypothetical protein [Candidatus Peregrinibacteria bacterium]
MQKIDQLSSGEVKVEHVRRDMNIGDIAEQAGISGENFTVVLIPELGETPMGSESRHARKAQLLHRENTLKGISDVVNGELKEGFRGNFNV